MVKIPSRRLPSPNITFSEIQILGPFNSGTGLMYHFKHALYPIYSRYNRVFWKHSIPPHYFWEKGCYWENTEKIPIDKILETTLFICMLRLPYYWILSTCDTNFNLIKFDISNESFSEKIRAKLEFRGNYYDNIVQLWNSYYRGYQNHLPEDKTIFVKLEDLVQDPMKIISILNGYLELFPHVDIRKIIEDISNKPCRIIDKKPCTYGKFAKKKYTIANVSKKIDERDLQFINQNLDSKLMEYFDYPFVRWDASAKSSEVLIS